MPGSQPNIIWIMVDQMRHDAGGFAGSPLVRTPNLDRMSLDGVTFEHAYCASPVCSPARGSWVTGLYPHDHMQLGNYHLPVKGIEGYHVRKDTTMVSDVLSNAGYSCGMIGPWHMGNDETPQHGFDSMWCCYRYVPEEKDDYLKYLDSVGYKETYLDLSNSCLNQYETARGTVTLPCFACPIPTRHQRTTWAVDRAIDFVNQQENPYFLFLNIKDPHPTVAPPRESLDLYKLEDIPEPEHWDDPLENKPEFQKTFKTRRVDEYGVEGLRIYAMHYMALVSHIDTQLGRLFRTLEDTGHTGDTLVVFHSDHGELLGEHGFINKVLMYESSVRVPLLMRWPDRLPAGFRVSTPFAGVDLAPTLLDMVDLKFNERIQGHSTAGEILAQQQPDEHPVFAEISHRSAIGNPDAPAELRGHCVMARHRGLKYVVYRTGEQELYDLDSDPHEMVNLADLPANSEQVSSMRRLIKQELAPDPGGPYGWCLSLA